MKKLSDVRSVFRQFEGKPNEVSIEITHGCPNECLMCSSNSKFPSPVNKEISYQDIADIVLISEQMGTRDISISGGEPFIHSNFYEILKTIHACNMRPVVYTSGIMFDKDGELISIADSPELGLLDAINQFDKAKIIFDVQGHDAQLHNKIMGKNVFDLELDSILRCFELNIPTETHTVPQRENIRHLDDILDFSLGLGVDKVSFLRLVGQGRAKDNGCYVTKREFEGMQYQFVEWSNSKKYDGRFRCGHPIDWRFLVDDRNFKKPICRGGLDAPLIQPDGTVDVCPAWKDMKIYAAGNVRRNTIEEIWQQSDNYRVFRSFVHEDGWQDLEECMGCKHIYDCRGGCVAQRLLQTIKSKCLPLDEAILIGKDPMCFYEEI